MSLFAHVRSNMPVATALLCRPVPTYISGRTSLYFSDELPGALAGFGARLRPFVPSSRGLQASNSVDKVGRDEEDLRGQDRGQARRGHQRLEGQQVRFVSCCHSVWLPWVWLGGINSWVLESRVDFFI